MSVGIQYLYEDMKKNNVKMIGGYKGIKNKVRWTHIVESEEIASFLQGKEMVFTTGIGINDEDELFNLIRKTKEKNASGIVINTGKYIEKVNEDIIDYCNKNEFPLFVVPWNIRIAEIMKSLTLKIIESEKTYEEISNAIKGAIFLPKYEELYIPTLKKIGFNHSWKYTVTIIEVESKRDKNESIRPDVSEVKLYIEEKLVYIRNNYFAIYTGEVIIILFYNIECCKIDNILKDLYIDINKKFDELNFYVGIGKHTSSLEKLHKGYEEAKSVAKVNKLLRNNNVHIRYSELGLYRLLLAIENKELVKEFHDETLGELEIYDEINNTDYVELLINYFENNCKINETANSLYIHRNTVNNKLNKIEEILDLNLSDIGNRSKIYLSLMIRNIT